MPFFSTKKYDHSVGLSVCFRQWRASESHCRYLHGYALAVTITFKADTLYDRNWVVDFGGMKGIKEFLQDNFDHRLIVAQDDPHLEALQDLQYKGIASIIVMEHVGCEKFAEYIFYFVKQWLLERRHLKHVQVATVTVAEHNGNNATYYEISE